MKTQSLLSTMNLKVIFSVKHLASVLLIVIIFSIWQNVKMQSVIEHNKNATDRLHKTNYMNSSLSAVLSNAEGLKIKNLVLQNVKGSKTFGKFFEDNNYCIIIFQNGIVCDPCLEFVGTYWSGNSYNFPNGLSNQLIIIGDKNDRSTFVYLKKNRLENSYFIDINRQIRKDLSLNNLPTNFIFLIDNKQRVIYAEYFTSETKDKFDKFIRKAIRLVENE